MTDEFETILKKDTDVITNKKKNANVMTLVMMNTNKKVMT